MGFFIVSVPFDPALPQTVAEQLGVLGNQLSIVPKHFHIPAGLKVGSLDTLLACSDDLSKVDNTIEAITFKLLAMLEDLSGAHNVGEVMLQQGPKRTEEFLTTFQWNEAQFPIGNATLKQLITQISDQIHRSEEQVRSRLAQYAEIRTRLAAASKRNVGSLTVRPIAQLVKQWYDDRRETEGPIETEFLTTLFVCVPTTADRDWIRDYHTLGEGKGGENEPPPVCPDSCGLITRTTDYSLYAIVVLKKFADNVRQACKDRKFTVREYVPEDDLSETDLEELKADEGVKKAALTKLVKGSFSDAYVGWIHLKAIRVFVESLLHYGHPPNFVAMVFHAEGKEEKNIRKQLESLYAGLRKQKFAPGKDEGETGNSLEMQYPYVSLTVRA